VAEALFWLTAGAVAATYLLYPGTVWALSCLKGMVHEPAPGREPRVTLVVAAHNEEAVIDRRLKNLSGLDYPVGRLDILVLSDGSNDGTAEVARAAAPSNAEVVHYPQRRGKSGVLRESLPRITGEIVAFTDANCLYEPGTLRHLVASFADPQVGCAVGCLIYSNTDSPQVAAGEGLYWRYENLLKTWESRLGSTIVANGSIYAIRRRFLELDVTHVDFDSLLPLKVLRQGFRVVFETRARAWEKAAETLAEEFRRKVRIINQQIWGLLEVGGLLTWRTRWAAVALFFHKLLRWSVPFLLLANLVAALIMPASGLRTMALAAHAAVALAAITGWILQRGGWPAGPLRTATYFWAVNLASALAVVSFLAGHRIFAWEKARSTR
jgi:cellulose synthase/poly-beta-1,6-N-acetylglucosamine synthase-like glycosyltransferase